MSGSFDTPGVPYRLLRPFAEFFQTAAAGGILLIACAAIALAWANSPFAPSYAALWSTPLTVGAGSYVLTEPLLFWVNDGLMAVFFLLVGLEIKREVLGGELASPRKAALPLLAAVGGMLVPATLYALLNVGGEGAGGWGIPMATDIAFSLGVLALLGRRAPLALKVFLTALAIADDLGAVLVIALFYGHGAHASAFAWAAALLAALLVMNRMGVRRLGPYLVGGVALWIAVHASGVHATVAGVLLALTIPARRRTDAVGFLRQARHYLDAYGQGFQPPRADPTPEQLDAVHALEQACEGVQTPLRRIEHDLHGPVAFGIMPVFALANAGVAIEGGLGPLLAHPISLGVLAGLVIGKPLGVFAFSYLAVKVGLAEKPQGVTWRQVLGVSALAGIGFTMSIFIATLAFPDAPELLDSAKVGILLASAVSAALGWMLLAIRPATELPGGSVSAAPTEP